MVTLVNTTTAKNIIEDWMFGQSTPVNLIIRAIEVVILFYGIWLHAANVIGLWLYIILLMRLFNTKTPRLQKWWSF